MRLLLNRHKALLICFISLGILFNSCSSDDDNNDADVGDDVNTNVECSSDNSELPASFSGTYTSITNEEDFTVTIVESDSSCNFYTISFSNDLPSIEDIAFAPIIEGISYIDRFGDERERVIGISFDEDENRHIISIFSNDPLVTFGGEM